jgi:hypothetical protein
MGHRADRVLVLLFGLAAAIDRRLLALPAAAGALLSGLGGRFPAAEGLRRTAVEIEEEWSALKALRGDFRDLLRPSTAEDLAEVSRWEDEGGGGSGAEDAHDRTDRHAGGPERVTLSAGRADMSAWATPLTRLDRRSG